MNSNIKEEIFEFINQNFSNDRKGLREKANGFLKNPRVTDLFLKEFKKLNIVAHFQSLSSKTDKFSKEEMGDISDIWTFYLNKDIDAVDMSSGYEDWDFEKYLETGKDLYCCRVWINWFLKVYYIQSFSIMKKDTSDIYNILNLESKAENIKYQSIINVGEIFDYQFIKMRKLY